MQHQAPAVGPETVGQDNVGARIDEGPMQALDPIGTLGVPEFGRITRGQAHGEKVGAGRSVRQQRPAFGEKRLQHFWFSRGPATRFEPYLALWRVGASGATALLVLPIEPNTGARPAARVDARLEPHMAGDVEIQVD